MFKKIVLKQTVAEVRDEEERVIKRVAIPPRKDRSNGSWRKALRELTNNGEDLFKLMHDIARGEAMFTTLPDGRVSEPLIPTVAERRAASEFLTTMMHGKPVSQTEVTLAEADAVKMDQLSALTDEQVRAMLKEFNGESVVDGVVTARKDENDSDS